VSVFYLPTDHRARRRARQWTVGLIVKVASDHRDLRHPWLLTATVARVSASNANGAAAPKVGFMENVEKIASHALPRSRKPDIAFARVKLDFSTVKFYQFKMARPPAARYRADSLSFPSSK